MLPTAVQPLLASAAYHPGARGNKHTLLLKLWSMVCFASVPHAG